MPNRVPLQSVVVQRDGKNVVPPIGAVFEFTDKEVAEIEGSNPDALSATISVAADDVPTKAAGKGKKAAPEDL
jgi:hypothetical protein